MLSYRHEFNNYWMMASVISRIIKTKFALSAEAKLTWIALTEA